MRIKWISQSLQDVGCCIGNCVKNSRAVLTIAILNLSRLRVGMYHLSFGLKMILILKHEELRNIKSSTTLRFDVSNGKKF